MKQGSLPILFVMLLFSGIAVAQTQTVTDNDLAKFREKRLEAERDYRENYGRLGFPSPEELEQQRAEDKKDLIELSDSIRSERRERDLLQVENEWRAFGLSQRQPIYNIQIVRGYTYPYYVPYFSYRRLPYKRPHNKNFSWRAGGGGLVYEPGGLSSYIWSAPPDRTERFRRP